MCQTAIVYRRIVDGKTLEFDHCGYLYKGSFVMFDKQTESEWIHVTAECMLGPMKGKRLDIVPTQLLSWKEWRLRHPNTTVMQDSESWHSQPTENNDFTNKRLREKIGLNVLIGGSSKLLPFELLESQRVINDDLDGDPFVATYVSNAKSAVAWSRSLNDKTLRFRAIDSVGGLRLEDLETRTAWDPLSGIALSGPLKGSQLVPLVGIPIRLRRYFDFFPNGSVFELAEEDQELND